MNMTAHFDREKTREIIISGDLLFPEGVTATSDGTFFVGSLFEGCIMRAFAGSTHIE